MRKTNKQESLLELCKIEADCAPQLWRGSWEPTEAGEGKNRHPPHGRVFKGVDSKRESGLTESTKAAFRVSPCIGWAQSSLSSGKARGVWRSPSGHHIVAALFLATVFHVWASFITGWSWTHYGLENDLLPSFFKKISFELGSYYTAPPSLDLDL